MPHQQLGQTHQSSGYAAVTTVADRYLLAQLMRVYSELAENQIISNEADKKPRSANRVVLA